MHPDAAWRARADGAGCRQRHGLQAKVLKDGARPKFADPLLSVQNIQRSAANQEKDDESDTEERKGKEWGKKQDGNAPLNNKAPRR